MNCPCYKCAERRLNCHACCSKYIEYKAEIDKARIYKQKIDGEYISYHIKKVEKAIRRKNEKDHT